jgi:DNA-binding CsgD family transcriptional regulator
MYLPGAACMSVDASILAIIEKLYAAAADEQLWQQVMQDILVLTDSVGATFCAIETADQPAFSTFMSVNFEQAFIDEYIEGMMVHDPTVQYIVAHPQQQLVHDSQFITEQEKDKHAYYDWHHRFSDTRHRLAGMASIEGSVTSGVTVHRTRRQGDYHPDHIARFACLLPHLERAVSLGYRLGTFGATQQMSFHLLDGNPHAIIVLDERGGVLFANRAANEVAQAGDGLALSKDGLVLRSRTDNDTLQDLIAQALGLAHGHTIQPAGSMLAHRPSGRRPYAILVSPLGRTPFMLTRARPAACIVIADPARSTAPKHNALKALKALYGLTPAEIRLAGQLMTGVSLQNAAEALGISYKTARTQLAAIFRKTYTSRQGELVKLLNCDVPHV